MTSWPVFISCSAAEKDLALLGRLHQALAGLEREGRIRVFHRKSVVAGEDVGVRLGDALEEARLVLLLVSVDYFTDESSYAEAERAMARQARGEAHVIPILLHACDWKWASFGRLSPRPENGQPVSLWRDQDDAWLDVVRGVRACIEARRTSPAADTDRRDVPPDDLAPSDDAAEPWNRLLQRVMRALPLREERLGHRVDVVPEPAPPPFNQYLEVHSIAPLGQSVTFAVGAISELVTDEIVEAFRSRVHARYGQPGSGVQSTLVYDGEDPPGALRRRARALGVGLVSLEDYEQLIDFSAYIQRQNARLASDPVYPPELFVPQRFRYSLGLDVREEKDALATLEEWLGAPHGRLVILLGEFGTGKTFLLHELARRLGEQGGPLVPVLIELRALEKARDFEVLVAQHLTLAGMQQIDHRAFKYMLAQGRIALLFDGFDELALRVSYDRAAEHFDTLLQAVDEDAKVVITSRTQHFLSGRQIRTALGEKALSRGFRMMELERFNPAQIRQFLVRRFGSEQVAERRLRLLERVRDLMGLSEIPRMLSFIAELDEDKLNEACREHGDISAAELYRMLLDRWLVHEFDRAHPKGTPAGLSLAQRWRAVTELAVLLWRRMERSIRLTELPESIHESVKALAAPEPGQETQTLEGGVITHQLGSGTLLRRDEGDSFSFLHQSVLEWLVARAAAAEVEGNDNPALLSVAEMSELMADFFNSLADKEKVITWARGVLAAAEAPEPAKKNALLVLRRLGVELREKLNLAHQDLRGQNLSHRDLTEADLSGADLTEARLVGARLDRATLRGARLVGTDLSRVSAVGTDFEGADLTMARLLGADLRDVRLTGARLSLTAIVGAALSPGALSDGDAEIDAQLRRRVQAEVERPHKVCTALAFSADGALLVSGHADGSVRLWAASSGQLIRSWAAHKEAVSSIAVSPRGRTLVSAGRDASLFIWEIGSGRLQNALRAHKADVTSVAFSPDGRTIASGSRDRMVVLWDAASGRLCFELHGHEAWVNAVVFSPDGTMVASGSNDHTVHIWETSSGRRMSVLSGQKRMVTSIGFVPGAEESIAVGLDDGAVLLMSLASGKPKRILERAGLVKMIAFSSVGDTMVTAGGAGSVRLWDVASGVVLRDLHSHHGEVSAIAYSSDGRMVASAGSDSTLWVSEVASGKGHIIDPGRRGVVTNVAFSQDGAQLALGTNGGVLWFCGAETYHASRTPSGHERLIRGAAFMPDGRQVITLDDYGRFRCWAIGGEESLAFGMGAKPDGWRSFAISPDGQKLAAGDASGALLLFARGRGGRPRPLYSHRAMVTSVAFSPDGAVIASGSQDRTVCLISVGARGVRHTLMGHGGGISSVAFSPDGQFVASGSSDRTVRLWDPDTGSSLRTLKLTSSVRSVAFSATRGDQDWRLVAGCEDGSVSMSDSGKKAPTVLRAHHDAITTVTFSPDGRLLATASFDGTARLWHVATRTLLATLVPRPEGWAAFTPDGRYKVQGDIQGAFWHVVGLCRFEPGELDPYLPAPLRVPDGEPLFTIPPDSPDSPDPELPPAESPTSP